jgi:hypothetical protein
MIALAVSVLRGERRKTFGTERSQTRRAKLKEAPAVETGIVHVRVISIKPIAES